MNSMVERRQFGRRNHRQHAWIAVPGRPMLPCVIENMSAKGAFLRLSLPKWLPYRFGLRIDPASQVFACEIKHTSEHGVGVLFCVDEEAAFNARSSNGLLRDVDEWVGSMATAPAATARKAQ